MFCKRALILTVFSLLMVSTLTATTTPNSSTSIEKLNQIPLAFTKNMGQWDERVLFGANPGGINNFESKRCLKLGETRSRKDEQNSD